MAERIHASSHAFADDPSAWSGELLARFRPGGAFGEVEALRGANRSVGGGGSLLMAAHFGFSAAFALVLAALVCLLLMVFHIAP